MHQLVFATRNKKKVEEVRSLLAGRYQVLTLDDIGFKEEIAETGTTFNENAAIKATYIEEKFGLDCFADDSGLEVQALNGTPGVYSARFAGEPSNDRANNALLLEKLKGVKDRNANFRTVIALHKQGKLHFFEGRVDGQILEAPRGEKGFGYDPLFLPDDYDRSFAEMSVEEKNRISHRAKAVNKLVDFLKSGN